MRPQPESRGDDLEAAANAAIAACDGNPHAALHALIVPNSFRIEQVDTLTKQLDWAWHLVSPGYTRSTNWRRMKSADAPRYIRSAGGFGIAGVADACPNIVLTRFHRSAEPSVHSFSSALENARSRSLTIFRARLFGSVAAIVGERAKGSLGSERDFVPGSCVCQQSIASYAARRQPNVLNSRERAPTLNASECFSLDRRNG